MSFSNLEDSDPEEANPYHSNTHDRTAEEQQYKRREDGIVNREKLGGLDKGPVHWVEDVDMPKDITAAVLAD